MSCFSEFDDTKENFILPVGLGRTVQEAVNSFHQRSNVEVHCRICKKITTSSRKAWFSDLPEILFVHLKRFRREGNITSKDYWPVIHGDNISISVSGPVDGSEDGVLCNDQAVIWDSNHQMVLDPLQPHVLVYAKFQTKIPSCAGGESISKSPKT